MKLTKIVWLLGITLLTSQLHAMTLESDEDEALSTSEVDQIMQATEDVLEDEIIKSRAIIKSKQQKKEEPKIVKAPQPQLEVTVKEEPKGSNSWLVGFKSSNQNITSVLENANGERTEEFTAKRVTMTFGYMMGDVDVYLNYYSENIDSDSEDILPSYTSSGLGLRYRPSFLTIGLGSVSLEPNVAFRVATATFTVKDSSDNQLYETTGGATGLSFGLSAELFSDFWFEFGFDISKVSWEYPEDGVVSYYDEQAVTLGIEYRF